MQKKQKVIEEYWIGERVESLSVPLKFLDQEHLEKIKIGFLSFPIRVYIPPPLGCYKCQKYGHIQ